MFSDLARRGLSNPHAVAYVKRAVTANNDNPERVEVPIWGGVLLYVSFVAMVVSISLVSYMLHEVITTLCMVESPVAAITVSPSTHEPADKEEKEGLLETGPTITLVNQKPITSSIRGTIKHLVNNAGRFARFRGYKLHILYGILFSLVSTFLSGALPHFPGMLLGLHKLDQENMREYSGAQAASLIVRVIAAFVFMVTCTLFLCLPAIVTLVRIEASILPEDQDTIVPFDRTFGGKVVSQLMGGSGKVDFLDAWRSFNWEARRRLIKLFVKTFFILMAMFFVFAHVLVAESFIVFGDQMGKIMRQAQKEGFPQ